jgi:hypothetical protein
MGTDDSQAYSVMKFSSQFLYKISESTELKHLKAVKNPKYGVPRVHTTQIQ